MNSLWSPLIAGWSYGTPVLVGCPSSRKQHSGWCLASLRRSYKRSPDEYVQLSHSHSVVAASFGFRSHSSESLVFPWHNPSNKIRSIHAVRKMLPGQWFTGIFPARACHLFCLARMYTITPLALCAGENVTLSTLIPIAHWFSPFSTPTAASIVPFFLEKTLDCSNWEKESSNVEILLYLVCDFGQVPPLLGIKYTAKATHQINIYVLYW